MLLSKSLRHEAELAPSKSSDLKPAASRSKKQKEREKKQLRKLAERKAKQGKMRDILSSLEAHKDDIQEHDFHKLKATKTLGREVPTSKKQTIKNDEKPEEPVAGDSSEEEEEEEKTTLR
jgi:hypothetical protein